jgi:hypothetical protein
MNVFNRIVMTLLSLAALAFGIIVLLLLGGIITPVQVSPYGILLRQWQFFTALNKADATTAAFVAAAIGIVGLIVLILELLPGPRKPAQFVVKRDSLGKVTVAQTSVRDLVQYEASTIPEVLETRQQVIEKPKGLGVYVRSSLSPEADAPQIGQLLQERIQAAIQRHIGLPVAEVQVATQIEPLEQHARRRVR